MNAFDILKGVEDALAPRPAPFAINKLDNFEYVELWYFTPEGCADASDFSKSSADEAFGLAQIDDVMALKPISSL